MNDSLRKLAEIRRHIAANDRKKALEGLLALKILHDDIGAQVRASKLLDSLPLTELGLRPIRIALLASTTVDHFASALKFWLAQEGFAAKIWISPFDTVMATVLDSGGELFQFKPDIVWFFSTSRDVRFDVAPGDVEAALPAVEKAVNETASLWQTLQTNLSCTILQNNADVPPHDCFGNHAGQVPWSRRNLLRRYNLELATSCRSGVVLFDLDHLSSQFGKAKWIDSRYWYHSKHAFGFEMVGPVAFQGSRLIAAMKGLAKKCLVLDLDNTLWGGVIGDDGLEGIRLGNGADGEAFVDFQRWLKTLKERGVVLTVCSKNEEENAKEPFLKHPDMHLKLDDISVFRANWNNKADNIREIANILNIGIDSLVFIDDNPVERNLVRQFLPMVAVPELPEDPSDFIAAIEAHRYFETVGHSSEDRERSRYYRDNAARADMLGKFKDYSDYLAGLDMVAKVGRLDPLNSARMAQLIGKSNQFNLTGIRYTEADLQGLFSRSDCDVRYYRLADRFGDNGLISVVVLKFRPDRVAVIDVWVMSCRVLSRTMEEFICLDILEAAAAHGCATVEGHYVPSPKNKLVSGLYERLGFSAVAPQNGLTLWRREIDDRGSPLKTFVTSSRSRN